VYREDGVRYSPVKFSVPLVVANLASTIAEAQSSIEAEIHRCEQAPPGWNKLCRPYDTRLEWGGRSTSCTKRKGVCRSSSR